MCRQTAAIFQNFINTAHNSHQHFQCKVRMTDCAAAGVISEEFFPGE